jgi:hypothetical protein
MRRVFNSKIIDTKNENINNPWLTCSLFMIMVLSIFFTVIPRVVQAEPVYNWEGECSFGCTGVATAVLTLAMVPEPASAVLLVSGLIYLAGFVRRFKKS